MILLLSRNGPRIGTFPAPLASGMMAWPGPCGVPPPGMPWAAWCPRTADPRVFHKLLARIAEWDRDRCLFVSSHQHVRGRQSLARWPKAARVVRDHGFRAALVVDALTPDFPRPEKFPWDLIDVLALMTPPAATRTPRLAALANAACDRGVPIHLHHVRAGCKSALDLAGDYGAASIGGRGWGRCKPDARPIRHLLRSISQPRIWDRPPAPAPAAAPA